MRKKLIVLLFIMINYFSFGEEKSYLIKEGTPLEITNQMVVVEIEYIDYNGSNQIGKIVVNKKVSKEVIEIFKEIKESGFQIEKIIPISEYNWDDDKSKPEAPDILTSQLFHSALQYTG